jgi:molybdenum cofactor cytidylyltransferase
MGQQPGSGMSLGKALRAGRGDVVSFVGGGGKTTSMFRLAAEMSAAGLRVVTTTTTHIREEEVYLAPAPVSIDEIEKSLTECLDRHGQCHLVGKPDGKGRVHGASLELITELSARPGIDAVVVEADGSRSLPFKAPGGHEPVVPEKTTILVPVVGLNTLGQPLDEEHVHRSEIAAALAHVPVGSSITAEIVARVLVHPQGGAKQRPFGARLVPLLNKTDTEDAFRQAGDLAEKLLSYDKVNTVIINSMLQKPSVLEAWVPTAGIILAAESAKNAGNSARAALEAGLDPVIVVVGDDAENARLALAGPSVRLVFNPEFAKGQSSSIRKGLSELPSRTGAAVFLFADQTLATAGMIETLIRAHRRTFAPVCVPSTEDKRGSPILFDKSVFKELKSLSGNAGIEDLRLKV